MPVMIVGVYCRKIAKPAPGQDRNRIDAGNRKDRAKTDGRDRHSPPEITGDHVIDPRIEGLEFSARGAGKGTSGQQGQGRRRLRHNADYDSLLTPLVWSMTDLMSQPSPMPSSDAADMGFESLIEQ